MNRVTLKDYISGVKGTRFEKSSVKRVVEQISLDEDTTENEKIEMLEMIQKSFGIYKGQLLTRSLFNILSMEKNGVIAIPTRAKLANYDNLVMNGLAYTTYKTVRTVQEDILSTEVVIGVLVLSPYGWKVRNEYLEQGKEYIKRQIEIFEKLGF